MMRFKNISASLLACLLVVMGGGIFLASCGSSTSTTDNNFIPLPVVTVSPASASVQAGAPLQFTATVVSSSSTTITWTVNNIQGGNSTLGTVNSSGLYMAPAAVPNPATVTVKAVSSAETFPYGSAIVTITPTVNASVAVEPTNSSTPVGTGVQFSATVTGTTNTAVNWSVNGVAGGSSTLGTISAAGIYTAPSSVPSPPTVVVTATSQANTSDSGSTTLTLTGSNTAPLYVNFGPNGNTGNPATTYYNGLYTSVTLCIEGSIECQTIPDILVDTGSVGLRVLNSALTTLPAIDLTTVRDSAGNQVEECTQFRDTSYTWGPVLVADVVIASERASSVPIQVIGDTTENVPAPSCLSLGQGPSLDTVAALGANGILGVGAAPQDCGLNCAAGQSFAGYPYYVCPKDDCTFAAVPVVQQVANPVAFFNKDNNGVEIILPSISSTGAPSLPFFPPLDAYTSVTQSTFVSAGQMIFGVGTESNNALPSSVTLFPLDAKGHFPKVVYNGGAYVSGGFLDSRSNALYVSDAQTLGIEDCTDSPYYCPGATVPLSLTLCAANAVATANLPCGANVASETVALSLANADSLIDSGNAAFNDLGHQSSTSVSTDYFDLGLPFFFGRTVFVGIAGTTIPNKATAPNGYFAF